MLPKSWDLTVMRRDHKSEKSLGRTMREPSRQILGGRSRSTQEGNTWAESAHQECRQAGGTHPKHGAPTDMKWLEETLERGFKMGIK
jgi:hypothetical protein